MGVFARADSPVWWLYLETIRSRERTDIRIGTTTAQRHDSRQLAEDRYHQRMNEIAARLYRLPTAQPAIRFSKYAEAYKTDVIAQQKGHERAGDILKRLTAFLGQDLLQAIDRERVRQYQTARRATVSASTVNRELDLLKAMLRDAVPKYLTESPIAGLKRLPVVPPKRRLMTPAEERRLLPKLAPDDRAILLMGLDTLCRLKDILDLRKEDDHGRTLYIQDPKDPVQSSAYVVPVSARLRKALDRLPKSDSPYMFPRRRGAATERDRRSGFTHALRRACKAAHVPYGRAEGGITFHWATRRTGATRLLQRGVDLKTIQALGHWKTPDLVLNLYTEGTSKAAHKAVELIGAFSPRSRGRRKSA